ncbi:MAG: divalent metal cation transporter [Calditrichaeota bacterium]|nr:MAG: divalent metal cation transporter [Calditrichota bacterium]
MTKSHTPIRQISFHLNSRRIIDEVQKNRERIKELGPGIITGGAGDDPAGIVTYTAVGATTGFSLLWLMLLSTPMMVAVQDMAARVAIITGKSLPEIVSAFYSRKLSIFMVLLLSLANMITIGADLQGIAAVLGLLTGVKPVHFLIPITAIIAYLVMFKAYRTVKKVFLGFTFVLVTYIISAMVAHPDLKLLLIKTFIPTIQGTPAYILAALGLLGTTISPYLLFWQADEEKEEHKTVAQAKSVKWDTAIGMVYSNLIAFCIIITGAIILFGQNKPLNTVRDAALALRPVAGESAFLLFSVGILSAGFLAIPVLAGSTAYAVADSFGWREGLDYKVSDAKGFYATFFGALIFGDLIYLSPFSAVEGLYYSQVLDGILLPILVGILLLLNNNKAIVGEFRNSRFNNIFGWMALGTALLFTVAMAIQWFQNP